MMASLSLPVNGYGRHEVLPRGPEWKQIEEELSAAKVRLSLFQRLAWAEVSPEGRYRLLTVRDDDGRVLGGVALQLDKSRVLPGYRYLRVTRLGEGIPREAWEPIIVALTKLVREEPKILRLSVRVFSRHDHEEIGALLERHGFHQEPRPTAYRNTLSIDLLRDEAAIMAGLNKSARKNLRDADRSVLCVRTITEDRYVDRITLLEQMAIRRTQGTCSPMNWASVMKLSRDHPELSRVVGLFLSERELEPESLVGFAWGCINGPSGEYRAGGTTHIPNMKVSISHRLVRDLILWSKRQGAQWFDMGGVTVGEPVTHPLHGVTVFKRHFTHHMEVVGDEWSLEPHPVRAELVRRIGDWVRESTDALQRMRNGHRRRLS
jgi:hypothetical protein